MVKKKTEKQEPVYVFQAWKIKITFRALIVILSMMIAGTILIVNVGYDKKNYGGCF